jgi:hypothetical protein
MALKGLRFSGSFQALRGLLVFVRLQGLREPRAFPAFWIFLPEAAFRRLQAS